MSLRKVQVLRLVSAILSIVLVIVNGIAKSAGNETVHTIMFVATVISLAVFMYLTSRWKCPACKQVLPVQSHNIEYCPHCGEYLFYEE